jgi:spore germination cell wall hydrolase CwlJ-like protein
MQLHRSTVAALAATLFLTFFAADGSGANAEPTPISAPAPAPALTDETVPAAPPTVEFHSSPVIQPATATAPEAEPTARSLDALVSKMTDDEPLSRELECLAGAVYFESRGEPLAGQLAVAQVVVNRSESGTFPRDYCGVVYQRAQFSFVRGQSMPHIDRGSAAWDRAAAIARIAHQGLWDSDAKDALYFHARSVRPSWSRMRIARATINSHVFYR